MNQYKDNGKEFNIYQLKHKLYIIQNVKNMYQLEDNILEQLVDQLFMVVLLLIKLVVVKFIKLLIKLLLFLAQLLIKLIKLLLLQALLLIKLIKTQPSHQPSPTKLTKMPQSQQASLIKPIKMQLSQQASPIKLLKVEYQAHKLDNRVHTTSFKEQHHNLDQVQVYKVDNHLFQVHMEQDLTMNIHQVDQLKQVHIHQVDMLNHLVLVDLLQKMEHI